MRKVWVLVMALLTVACDSTPQQEITSSNQEVSVAILTTFDGITLYRVMADGKRIYVAKQGVAPVSLEAIWSESCGKSCTREVRQQTLAAAPISR